MVRDLIKEFKILKSQLDKIIDDASHAAADGGKEICGLLVDKGYFIELIQVNNKHKKGGGFEFYPKEIRHIQNAVERLGNEIIGIWHSHPLFLSEPGESDIVNALDDEIMLIISVLDSNAAL